MLKDYFFTIGRIQKADRGDPQNSTVDQYLVEITLDPGHEIYRGHFPGNPVVPGVCQIRILTELMSEIEGCEVIFQNADQVKFLSMIDPRQHQELSISLSIRREPEDHLHISAAILDDEKVFFKCNAGYSTNKNQS